MHELENLGAAFSVRTDWTIINTTRFEGESSPGFYYP